MKDRQPTQVLENGAIRYGIYNVDGTLDHYEYMKREDAPTVVGTPLNKANLLSDETEAKIWRGNDKPEEPTVNDALHKLADGTAKIGDIAITARTDLSSAWLPCDGREVTSAQYPALYSILRSSASALPWQQVTLSGVTYGALPFFANGLWICIGLERVADSYNDQTVYLHVYTSSDFSSWADHRYMINCISFSEYSSSYELKIEYADAQYSNGYYYIAAIVYDGNGYGYSCVFATISNDFSACQFEAVVEPSTTALRNVCKVQLVATSIFTHIIMYTGGWSPNDGYTSYGLTMYYRVSASNWSDYIVPETSKYITQVAYSHAHNVYYVIGNANSSTNTIYKTTDFINWEEVGTVNSSKVTFPSGFYGLNAAAIDPDSGLIVLIYANTATNTNYPSAYKNGIFYAYSTDFGTTWNSGKMLTNDSRGGTQADRFYPDTIALKNAFLVGTAVVDTKYALYAASDLDDNMYKATLPTGSSVKNAFAISDSALVVCGDGKGSFFSCDYSISSRPVPTIYPDSRSHAYIKALEE